MKKPYVYTLIITLLLVVFVLINQKPKFIHIQGETQGTSYHISYLLNKGNKNIKPLVDKQLLEFDLSLSTYNGSSIISAINRNEEIETDVYFNTCFNEARRVWEASCGMFDITIAPLASAYGFGPGKRMDLDTGTIDSLLVFVGMEKISLMGNSINKQHPGVQLNVNAIAQGYAVDVLCQLLDTLGSDNYMVEIGGEVRTKGKNPDGELWRIGIDKPVEGNAIAGQNLQVIIPVNNKSVATSGNYRKYYQKDGKKYTHTINPKTGQTIQSNLLSATIITNNCITADAFATACMASGLAEGKRIIAAQNLDAYLIYADSTGKMKVFATPNIKETMEGLE